MIEIHQIHPSVSYGDAIGNEMVVIRDTLRGLGYKSNIYAQFIDPKMKDILPFEKYKNSSAPDNILIVHYSIGYGDKLLDFVKSLPDKKIMVYHNITPSEFFNGINSDYERLTKAGRIELASIRGIIDIALGDSEYNRKELNSLGYRYTGVLPIAMDFSKYDVPADANIIKEYDDDYTNILFVGRVSPNKKFEDVIKSFYYYKKYINQRSRLFLVGSSVGMDKYVDYLKLLVDKLEINDIHFIGHIKFEELMAYYKLADVFLCMSEHEGFCVPLVECMYLKVPIIAYNSTAIPYTLGGSGILVYDKNYKEIAELINLVVEDKNIRESVIKSQSIRLDYFKKEHTEAVLKRYIDEVINNHHILNIQIEGTFEDSYSLSIINRNLALALDYIGYDVSLYPTTGTGDYMPDPGSITDSKVKELWMKNSRYPEFSIRNIYPPITRDIKGKYKLIYFYWEESRIPEEWVKNFNDLDAVIVASKFIKRMLIDNGVTTRIAVIPNGVNSDLIEGNIKPADLNTKKGFKFLSVSSGFPRKGIDVLIRAYLEEFSKEDNVCLVIKTFPNVHNKISEIIKKHTSQGSAEIIHIDRDMHDTELASLYKACDCLVAPTRGEGFGLPMAEAMLARIPVITTNYSGQVDFCTNDTAYLIDYKLTPSNSHVKSAYNLADSKWAEPDVQHLKKLMRHVYENRDADEVKEKVENAYRNIKTYTWGSTAKKTVELLEAIKSEKSRSSVRVGIVSTWNVKCGIAEYTKYLTDRLSSNIDKVILANHIDPKEQIRLDDPYVIRCWDTYSSDLNELYETIILNDLSAVHFQFNFGFFELKSLASLIKRLKAAGVKVIITFHSTSDVYINHKKVSLANIKDTLKQVDVLWVHSHQDVNKLNAIGIADNVVLIPHGNTIVKNISVEDARKGIFTNSKIIALFGFLLPHKGILEAIKAVAQLKKVYPDILFLVCSSLYPNPESEEYYVKCKKEIETLGLEDNIILFTDYLAYNEVIALLQCADIILMPYKDTGESASGAIRLALAAGRLVMVTDIQIFSEFNGEVYKIKRCVPEEISNGVKNLYGNAQLRDSISTSANKMISQNSWENIARRYADLLKTIK